MPSAGHRPVFRVGDGSACSNCRHNPMRTMRLETVSKLFAGNLEHVFSSPLRSLTTNGPPVLCTLAALIHPLPHPPRLHLDTVCPFHAEYCVGAWGHICSKTTSRQRTCARTHAKACQARRWKTNMLVRLCVDVFQARSALQHCMRHSENLEETRQLRHHLKACINPLVTLCKHPCLMTKWRLTATQACRRLLGAESFGSSSCLGLMGNAPPVEVRSRA